MRRAREAQLARLARRSSSADDAAAWHSAALRARVKLGAALRQALARSGIDPAGVTMLRVGNAAADELAAPLDSPARPAADTLPPDRDPQPDPSAALFEGKMEDLVRRYRDRRDIDLARASLAEALAWSIAHLECRPPG